MECKSSRSTCVPPSISNLASRVPLSFASDGSKSEADIVLMSFLKKQVTVFDSKKRIEIKHLQF